MLRAHRHPGTPRHPRRVVPTRPTAHAPRQRPHAAAPDARPGQTQPAHAHALPSCLSAALEQVCGDLGETGGAAPHDPETTHAATCRLSDITRRRPRQRSVLEVSLLLMRACGSAHSAFVGASLADCGRHVVGRFRSLGGRAGGWAARPGLVYRRRNAALSAGVPKFQLLSATLIVTPGGTIWSMRSSRSLGRSIPSAAREGSRCSMVRGPMIAEVTAGWRGTKAMAIWMRG